MAQRKPSYWSNGLATLHQADARQLPMPDQSVHCVVTSPPYFGLRVYRADSDAMIGLEDTPEQWMFSMLEVMGEVWRVLRDDGVLWVNLGDSYGGSGKGQNGDGTHAAKHGEKQHTSKGTLTGGLPANSNHAQEPGTHSNNGGQLLGIPWRFALAMQEAGWILRSDVIWAKKSAMPESLNGTRWERCRVKVKPMYSDIFPHPSQRKDGQTYNIPNSGGEFSSHAEYTDCPGCPKCEASDGLVLHQGSWRCTSVHEYIFQFVKGMGYYSDGEAVKTLSSSDHPSGNGFKRDARISYQNSDGSARGNDEQWQLSPTANRRSVWNDIRPDPFGDNMCGVCHRSFSKAVIKRFPKDAQGRPICPLCEEPLLSHYAVFPTDLARLCIQASTSEAGVCADCGAQWARVLSTNFIPQQDVSIEKGIRSPAGLDASNGLGNFPRGAIETKTLSWRPTCTCNADKVPATVLDPFCGTATTMLAAMRLGRRSVGVDLSTDYLNMAIKRLSGQTLPMFATG